MMKKRLLTIMFFAFISTAIVGCGETNSHKTEALEQNGDKDQIEDETHAHYQCPMNCEEGKTYKEKGSCPVCGMDLKEKES